MKLSTSPTRTVLAATIPGLVVIAIIWGFIYGLIRYELADTLREVGRVNGNLALAFEAHTVRTIASVEQLLEYVAHEYTERGVVDIDELAEAAGTTREFVRSIAIVDASGNVVIGSHAGAPANLADREFFRYHRDHPARGVLVSPPTLGRINSTLIIPVSRRITAPGGGFGGVVAAAVDPGYFDRFYQQMDIGRDGMVLLVGLDGLTRARHTGIHDSAGQDMGGSTLMREQAKQASGSFLSAGRVEGVARYTSYRTVPEYELVVAVGMAAPEVLLPYYERRNAYLWSGVAFTLLVLAFAGTVAVARLRRQQAMEEHQREEARFRATFDQALVAMAHVDLQGRVIEVNRTLCEMVGYAAQELLGRNFIDFKFPDERRAADDARRAMLQTGETPTMEHRYRRKDGSDLWANVAISMVRDPKGNPDYFVVVAQDITAQKQAQAQVLHQATYDLLTDLPNRSLFRDRLQQVLKQAQRKRWTAGVMFMDLDRFKAVNDSFGHAAGDALLREVGTRLARSVRASDTVARVGGDEFAVVLGELSAPSDATLVARKILETLAAPMSLEGHEYFVTVSIGITLFPADGNDIETLLRNADAAMFKAKQAGRNCFQFFAPQTASPVDAGQAQPVTA